MAKRTTKQPIVLAQPGEQCPLPYDRRFSRSLGKRWGVTEKFCYYYADLIVREDPRLADASYVEGFATCGFMGHGLSLEHAWIEWRGKRLDPTWALHDWHDTPDHYFPARRLDRTALLACWEEQHGEDTPYPYILTCRADGERMYAPHPEYQLASRAAWRDGVPEESWAALEQFLDRKD